MVSKPSSFHPVREVFYNHNRGRAFDKSTIDLLQNLYELLSVPKTQQGIRRMFGKSKRNRVTSPMIGRNLFEDFVRHADSRTAMGNELSKSSLHEISLETVMSPSP